MGKFCPMFVRQFIARHFFGWFSIRTGLAGRLSPVGDQCWRHSCDINCIERPVVLLIILIVLPSSLAL